MPDLTVITRSYETRLIAVYPSDGQEVTRLAYSPGEAASMLGISRELIDDLLRTGELRSVKAGRRRIISKVALTEYLQDPGSAQEDAFPRLAYSPEETMAMLGIGKTMLYDLIASGELRSVKRGGRRFIARTHLDAFLEVEV